MSNIIEADKSESQSVGSRASILKKILRNPSSLAGLIIITGMILMAIFGPYLVKYDAEENFWDYSYGSPNLDHIMGTDHLGRDIFTRIVIGARPTIIIGIFSTLITLVIGVILGSIAGYFGGFLDNLIMRFTDILMTFPTFFFLIILISVFEVKGIGAVFISIGVLGWTGLARVVRSQFLSLKEYIYVEAAKGLGLSNRRIIFYHILPNSLSPIIVICTLRVGRAIITASALSFLGLIDPSVIMWGSMVNLGLHYMTIAWWISTFSGIFIFLTVLGFNLFGDGLRDVFDVRQIELQK